mmetsp:Transcript_2137/g.6688  ORF Transcript_2137/g.6688 Transcript_2137/m.6688 type:complete len:245 (-) Transcript_2137:215-949(-)
MRQLAREGSYTATRAAGPRLCSRRWRETPPRHLQVRYLPRGRAKRHGPVAPCLRGWAWRGATRRFHLAPSRLPTCPVLLSSCKRDRRRPLALPMLLRPPQYSKGERCLRRCFRTALPLRLARPLCCKRRTTSVAAVVVALLQPAPLAAYRSRPTSTRSALSWRRAARWAAWCSVRRAIARPRLARARWASTVPGGESTGVIRQARWGCTVAHRFARPRAEEAATPAASRRAQSRRRPSAARARV